MDVKISNGKDDSTVDGAIVAGDEGQKTEGESEVDGAIDGIAELNLPPTPPL